MIGKQMNNQISIKDSLKIHKEENRVYYDEKIGFYKIKWIETGNSDLPQIEKIKT